MPLTRIISDGLTDQNVTSPKISPNLQISLVRVLESANVFSTAIGGNVDIDVSNNTVYYFSANTTANVTFNLRANAIHSLNSTVRIGDTISLALAVNHGTQRHMANVYVDGEAQTMYYIANTRPTSVIIANQEINLFSYSVIRTGLSSYVVLAANTLFGLG
jgi:hypothetical protein